MNRSAALNQYRQVGVQTGITDASPHKMISMLFGGISEKLSYAKGVTTRQDVAKRGQYVSSAIGIIDTLRASLDYQQGGEVAQNLASLYDYMERRLTKANMDGDASIIEEVSKLVDEISAAWEEIPAELR